MNVGLQSQLLAVCPKLDVEVGEKKGTATDHRDAFRRTSSLWSSRHWIRGP